MAIIHHAELTPSKPAALAEWVPRQPWFAGDAGAARVPDPDPNRALAPESVDEAATVVAFAGGALRVWRRPRPVGTADGRPHLIGDGADGPDLRLADLL